MYINGTHQMMTPVYLTQPGTGRPSPPHSSFFIHSFIIRTHASFPHDTPVPYPYTLPHTIPCPRLSSSNFLLFQAIRPHSSKTCYPHRSSQKHSSSPFQRFNSWPQRWKGWAGRMRKQPVSKDGTACCLGLCLTEAERNLELKDQLLALRDATAQSYAHAEDLKRQWADIEKSQQNLYQVRNRENGLLCDIYPTGSESGHRSFTSVYDILSLLKTNYQKRLQAPL